MGQDGAPASGESAKQATSDTTTAEQDGSGSGAGAGDPGEGRHTGDPAGSGPAPVPAEDDEGTPGGLPQADVEDRPNVGTVKPSDYPNPDGKPPPE